jgi:hypothetical protein
MTITTVSKKIFKNPNNETDLARHRSTWKGDNNVLSTVLTNLQRAQYVTYQAIPYHGTPKEVREMWKGDFHASLPNYVPGITAARIIQEVGYSGVDTWLNSTRKGRKFNTPPDEDAKEIWEDFAPVFARRSNPGTKNAPGGTTREVIFMCYTLDYFDLIYSKWGYEKKEKGTHWFYHWTSVVGATPTQRPGIDVPSDDQDG